MKKSKIIIFAICFLSLVIISCASYICSKNGHQWDFWETTKEATCTEEGEKQRECINCHTLDYEKIPPLGHSYDNGKVTKEPTLDEEGLKVVTCTRCGTTKEVTVEKLKPIYATDVVLSRERLGLLIGETFKLEAEINPNDASYKKIDWAKSKDGFITIDSEGNVTGITTGSDTITATSEDGKASSICIVNVNNSIDKVMSGDFSKSGVWINGIAYSRCPTTFYNDSIHDVNIDKVELFCNEQVVIRDTNQELLGICKSGNSKSIQAANNITYTPPATFKTIWYFTYNNESYTYTYIYDES